MFVENVEQVIRHQHLNPTQFQELKSDYPFESNWYALNNGSLMHYVDEGDPDAAEVMLMVHGNPTWSYYFRNLIKNFKNQYRVIAIDHLGCGLSSKNDLKKLTLQDRIEHLSEFIEGMGLKKIHLVAHDWGGAIGMGSVLQNREKFESLIFLNTAVFNSTDIPASIAWCRRPWLGSFINRFLGGFSWAATFMASSKKLSKKTKNAYLFPYNSFKNRKAIDDFVKDIPLGPSDQSYQTLKNIEDQLLDVELPVLLIWGAKDFCFHLGFFKKFLDFFPHAQGVIFEEAGHYVLEDDLEQATDEIRKFLNNDQ
ncbi:MAG: alpha/beta fold hydrolase [Halobacteriovoraceae bacterium]|nr:alpha/beta fold hydrolase [Halobacteriovoraceae bacterium]MCB9093547.1 alpha/beta fold hydrolase [Halobacteriovoraceae bacterium]